jgi:TolB-like protein
VTDASEGENDSAWAKLRRRKVVQWGIVYAAGAWGFLQGLEYVVESFNWPQQYRQIALLGSLIGLPVVLVLAWYHGDRGQQRVSRAELAIITLLFLVGGGIFWRYDKASDVPPPATALLEQPGVAASATTVVSDKSIAVLAFANMSADKDNEYFSDGVAEEILSALAKIDDLKVAGRTSSFYFKGRNESLATIGATLGVAHVLEGSVRKQGERLRISAQLLRVSDGVQMWSETFDGTDADIFALQEKIAQQVTSELKVALNAGQQARLIDSGTANPEAYALYLRATDIFNRRAAAELANAISQTEQAAALDPGFARAYSRMAALHALTPEYLGTDLDASMATAQKLARRALELQPAFAEPHAVLGYVAHLQKRFVSARTEFAQALAIDPDDPLANFWLAVTLVTGGYLEAGVAQVDRTLAIDPLLPNALHHRGRMMEWMGDLEGARRLLERARSVGARNIELPLGLVSQRQRRMDEARAEISAGIQFFSAGLPEDTGAILADGILGDPTARAAALARLQSILDSQPGVVPGIVPWALITLGEPEAGLRVVATFPTSSNLWHAALWSPRGKAARTSPGFPDFARKVGFAELWDQYGPPDLCRKDPNGDYRCE